MRGWRAHLYVVVDDVTTVTDERHPTSAHLQQVLDFTRDLTDTDRLLCTARVGAAAALQWPSLSACNMA